MYDAEAAAYTCDFIECLTHTDGRFAGKPFELFDWQREAIEPFYGTLRGNGLRQYQYLYLEIPKKNGKSELAAALALYHTFADGERRGEVYVVAADRENASIVFKASLGMLNECPALRKRARVVESMKLIVDTVTGTEYRVMSSEAYSKHGYKPSCVIFDELHAQPSRELWDIMTFGAGSARDQPVWIVLTTAGDDPDRLSIGWEIHERACRYRDIRAGIAEGIDDDSWLPIIYGYDGDDIYNEDNWFKANPSLGKTIPLDTVRKEAENAKNSEATERLFRWLRLNQWIALKRIGWLPLPLYDKTEGDLKREDLKGKRCYLGLDLSSTTDLTALVALFPPQAGIEKWIALFEAWIPEDGIPERERRDGVPYREWVQQGYLHATPGTAVDYEYVEARIRTYIDEYDVIALGADQWNSRMLTQRLMRDGVEVLEIVQSMAGMSPPTKDLERKIRRNEMEHERHPVARWCFGNVRVVVDGNENIKPMKNKSTGRIDIAVAWIIANAVALMDTSEGGSIYDQRGLVLL